ncbi:MAG TPA: LD-carboxypeptidase [Puia sp.]|jgi:muramoyltetrapeptide carboxypeptidase|nr:LD-carboxypeptidase [Puia sp.]
MITIPPFLRPGDTIGITCPAGFMTREKALTCIGTLETWGYRVREGRTLGGDSDNYFSGTDEQRLDDLHAMLADPGIDAILCGRGGYGLSRIIDRVDFSAFCQKPKWIIGFSDITVLHAHLFTNYKIATLHAPMAGAFNDGCADTPGVLSLKRVLAGEPMSYTCAPHPFNRTGYTRGILVGGNLSLLAHLVGSVSDIDTKGKILFLEDVGEYLYNIDRMLRQLKRSGKLDHLAGLVIGGFTETKDTMRPFGATVEDIIREVVKEYAYPVCYGFPVSHGIENVALKIGTEYTLTVAPGSTALTE